MQRLFDFIGARARGYGGEHAADAKAEPFEFKSDEDAEDIGTATWSLDGAASGSRFRPSFRRHRSSTSTNVNGPCDVGDLGTETGPQRLQGRELPASDHSPTRLNDTYDQLFQLPCPATNANVGACGEFLRTEDTVEIAVHALAGSNIATLQVPAWDTVGGVLRLLPVDDEVKPSLCHLVFGNRTLQKHERLFDCGVGDGAVLHFVRTEARFTLDLGVNNFGNAGLWAFADALPVEVGLQSLSLDHCMLEGLEAGRALGAVASKAPALEQVALGDNNGFGGLTLGTLGMGAAGVAALVQALAAPNWLRTVDLSSCGLEGDAGGRVVAALMCRALVLEQLTISGNNMLCAEGILSLARHLPASNALRRLGMGDCGLRQTEGACAVAAVVEKAPALTHLDLADNSGLGARGVVALVEALPESCALLHVDLHNCRLRGPAGRRALARLGDKLSKLQQLNFSNNPVLGKADPEASDEELQWGEAPPGLVRCSLDACVASSVVSELALKLSMLEELDLRSSLDGPGLVVLLEALADDNRLRSLNLGYCHIEGEDGGRACASICSRARALEHLSLAGNFALRTPGLKALVAGLPGTLAWRSFNVSGCTLDGAEAGEAIAVVARNAPALVNLELSDNRMFGVPGLSALAHGLPVDAALESLDLGLCGLIDQGSLGEIASVLTNKAPGLQCISVCGNGQLGLTGLIDFICGLQSRGGLRALNVGSCWLERDSGGSTLAELVRANPGIEHLDLSGNEQFGVIGLRAFVEQLPAGFRLRSLRMRDCGLLQEEGGRAAAAVVARFVNGASS